MLSALSDNPNLVTAVAVQELHDTVGLEVLIAVNTVGSRDGKNIKYLQEIKTSFESYFEILREAADG